jgi:arylsulfatase A-like enzyme
LVSALDVLPTICDYAGVRGPAIMQGQSLRPIIEKPQQAGHEYIVSEMAGTGGRSFMLRTKKHKYMVFPPVNGQKQEMFFDMQADPGEMKNLAAQPALATEIERHRKLLADWNNRTEEASHPIVPGPKAETGKAKKNKAKQKKAK